MVIDLRDLKRMRKSVGITQKRLAQLANVSQSLVAKVEAGLLDPTYSKGRQLISALETASADMDATAAEVCQSPIRSVKPQDSLQRCINLMQRYEISQTPVIENQQPLGFVSETIILRALTDRRASQVRDIMADAPPVVAASTPVSAVSDLLKFYSMVLVTRRGKLTGVITRADMIRNLRHA